MVRTTLNNALWTQALGSLVLGGICLALSYVGTVRMQIVVLASAIAAIWLVRRRPISPFGSLLGYPPPAHLRDPALSPLRIALETARTRSLPLVGMVWVAVLIAGIALGMFHPPELRAVLLAGEHISVLGAWPTLRWVVEWILIIVLAGVPAVAGSAFVLWLSIYLVMLMSTSPSRSSGANRPHSNT